ncbi:DUF302 domain-containing protein [Paenibacillus sp. NEAU-GSW1]|uniref:DUF302 domain-containing protein n=1 Tax=Paenibacillus sp. NEAU-GSW1 TaxID=2682486 RepID=UPI0012E308C7|nr:DUF302 domain-containing protein [Paenibacillus sp. NEAU-GSW1]MUT68089.1 DUF302 domain-containing protein [Paenibacillus sp. NEAU-GSW1]
MFHYTVQTRKSVDEAIHSLELSLKEEQFGVLWRFSIQDKLNEKGIEFNQRYEVLEVCNPFEAKKVLSENVLNGYFLPCKITVYEHGGLTNIGLPKPSHLIGMVGEESAAALRDIALDVERRLIMCIDKSI